MTRLIRTISSRELENQKKIFWLFLIAVFIIGSFYIYFSASAVYHMIGRNMKTKQMESIFIEYQQAEETYLKLLNEVNLDHAISLGFVENNEGGFAVRQTTVAQR